MTTDVDHLPPFTPIPARPANPLQPEQLLAIPRTKRKAKKKTVLDVVREAPKKTGKKKPAAKKAKPAKKYPPSKTGERARKRAAKVAKEPTDIPRAPRVRSARVAPLMLDAAAMLSTLAGLGKTEVTTMQAIVGLLNPLARPARKRVLNAVLALMGA